MQITFLQDNCANCGHS